jgi:two-component system nitrogen regulation sensor histidine kinase NtrY
LSTAGKIRLLLALLFASLLFTATIIQSTYTTANNLDQTAQILENSIHKKEADINDVLNDKAAYDSLKTIQDHPKRALEFIKHFITDRSIWFVSYSNDSLSFWDGVKVIPKKNSDIKNGVSFIQTPNGYYEAIKKSEGKFSAIFLFPIKINYQFQNQYLQNKFALDLLKDDNVDIADFSDANVYSIHSSINNAYLFSVKLKKDKVNNRFFYFELIAWLLTFITLCILVHAICKYFLAKGYVIISLITLALFIAGVRFFNLHNHWPGFIYQLGLFNPSVFSANIFYPTLGDFALNTLFITWFVSFLYTQRDKLLKAVPGKFRSYIILIVCTVALLATTIALLQLFFGLISNPKVNFDVYDVFNLTKLSLAVLLLLCFNFLIFFLLTETFLIVCSKLPITDSKKIGLFSTAIVVIVTIVSWHHAINLSYILLTAPVFLRGYAYRSRAGRIDSTPFIIIIFICALISFVIYYHIGSIKETNTRVAFINKLNDPADATADLIFKRIENRIISDSLVMNYFGDSVHYNKLLNRFQKIYFDGYLSRYTYKIYEFDNNGIPIIPDKNTSLNKYRDLVTFSSYKVSDYFYRVNQAFGSQNYFAILPVIRHNSVTATLVIDLLSKPSQPQGSFPDLLKDDSVKIDKRFNDYSFAFYKDNKLQAKGGIYGYDVINTTFKGHLDKYTTAFTNVDYNTGWYKNLLTYNHLIYEPRNGELIVVSKEENSLFHSITSLTFFFILLLLFAITVIAIRWLWLRIKILSIAGDQLQWIFKINFDRILYKTRIQFSIIAAVVITLLFVGFITFISLSTQYEEQQENMIREKISHITASYQNGLLNKYIADVNDESQVDFDDLANTYSTDLILYDLKGVPLITTQPRIYEDGLLSARMNARAFINLSKLHKSEFINQETIGDLKYRSVYAPLANAKGVTTAYLELPYFSNDADYNARIVSLLNIMINVYALIFIVIGLFAVIIARQITAPLSFMQLSLSKIIYGRKNEPIKWERDDEIGALINEYNKMLVALEDNAQKLAQSERESAWREMAKQVAHEIKNPLTPLKLGLQLLEKSWRDKDPKFDQKFERFSKSFVEQIESLSSIASEFSSFAKMPDTRLERINIFDMLAQAVAIFVHMDNIKINYPTPEIPFHINADRDQLLRCFNNLLKNAIEATQHQRPGIIDIQYTISDRRILLSIKDNGDGIPEAMHSKIFEPNFTTKSSGTGLGLAFVKNSIENADGRVWFETAQGVGTTFYMSLPAAL